MLPFVHQDRPITAMHPRVISRLWWQGMQAVWLQRTCQLSVSSCSSLCYMISYIHIYGTSPKAKKTALALQELSNRCMYHMCSTNISMAPLQACIMTAKGYLHAA